MEYAQHSQSSNTPCMHLTHDSEQVGEVCNRFIGSVFKSGQTMTRAHAHQPCKLVSALIVRHDHRVPIKHYEAANVLLLLSPIVAHSKKFKTANGFQEIWVRNSLCVECTVIVQKTKQESVTICTRQMCIKVRTLDIGYFS